MLILIYLKATKPTWTSRLLYSRQGAEHLFNTDGLGTHSQPQHHRIFSSRASPPPWALVTRINKQQIRADFVLLLLALSASLCLWPCRHVRCLYPLPAVDAAPLSALIAAAALLAGCRPAESGSGGGRRPVLTPFSVRGQWSPSRYGRHLSSSCR